ncbi:PREDICTED: putative late blight resistance protein homolog R1B-16 [Erythranthe guttata]|uniref:putative late blight resistance protein homolog R1B-16 n=1 Tax=Erythranthe guttata TaxID=4155 RepID=UPI00064D9E5E|nr:PREDICTED: putative late blight resistance protein homolog R1B-16 [Erythranthe guttata]|eukprot:XP_012846267.1 PREDICTED: putative late blight resistance protein homolog R1B-16 [Erythranthe guttata]
MVVIREVWYNCPTKLTPRKDYHSLEIHKPRASPASMADPTVIQDIDYVKDKVVNFKEEGRVKDHQKGPTYSLSAPPSTSSSNRKSKMVGFEEELIQLLDVLTARQSSLQIIPIVGMGGIGKTTLARNAYEHRLIVNHFDIRAWATISQEYSLTEIFSTLFSPQISSQSTDEQQLAQQLYQSLIDRRYLIILDDIWSINAWEKMMFFFPDNNNGSRIILTTRLSNVAVHFGSTFLTKKFLDKDKSWKLFCEKAFPHEGCCPLELEKIGKKIATKCKGLPLLIVVIGGFLRKSSRTQELWEDISNDISLIPNIREEEQNLDILSLSYKHLPVHLKPCFLYMGIFPEGREINVSKLIKLWIADGFIKPNKTQSLEEVAECYLKDLVDRNLLLVGRLGWNGKIKTCTIHDLLRDLCIKASQKEKFLYLIRSYDSPLRIIKERRILFPKQITAVNCEHPLFHILESAPLLTRTLLGNGGRLPFNFRLLRVLNAVDMTFSPTDILKHVNLRYFPKHFHISRELSWSIMSLLWNVQTLKIDGGPRFVAPIEIWSMPQLRHLESTHGMYLPDPPLRSQEIDDVIVLKNLHTFKGAVNLKLSEEVCKRIPNIKKLKLLYPDLAKRLCYNHLYNIVMLHKLEYLDCQFGISSKFSVLQFSMQMLKYIACSTPRSLGNLKYPTSLQRLILWHSDLEWKDMTAIGSLPDLEVLELGYDSVRGSKWNPVEGGFIRLKYLSIRYLELKYWNSERVHFPILENLILYQLHELEEIPLGIGEITTLGLIDVDNCNESTAVSAVRILEEQESLGNEDLRVRIHFSEENQFERFKEKVANFECFNSNNLQLFYYHHLDCSIESSENSFFHLRQFLDDDFSLDI